MDLLRNLRYIVGPRSQRPREPGKRLARQRKQRFSKDLEANRAY